MTSEPDDATAYRPSSDRPSDDGRARFTPGALLAGRYRIIAPLGRGGMGEVYRADDIRLGQQVALKFVPAAVERDPAALERLYAEVRIGRQVSHPNVCRLYDIVEWEGSHFISMEYIDGEDLGSLLRRIGKLPHDKAFDLTREICAGLAAAHGVGVIHRDLKPANIMIDGRGRARVTDFGLAALEAEAGERREFAGTPAYMSPEQLRGGEATQKSDLYALGLLVYEMFTGRRRFEARTTGELIEQHSRSDSGAISERTRELPPEIQRVIVRCLQEDPDARPPSIHAVIAALPGGDPLQAAIDAGETPSPEMVAAAGATGELRGAVAVPLLVLALILIVAAMVLQMRYRIHAQVKLPKRPEILADRAREIAASLGYTREPADTAFRLVTDSDWIGTPIAESRKWGDTATIQPAPLRFWYRESPREMMPLNRGSFVQQNDPPFAAAGMVRMLLDPAGRLVRFEAVPPHHMSAAASAPEPDWSRLLAAAGLAESPLEPVAPEWTTAVDNDRKVAWMTAYPDQPHVPIRIEAASYRGKPVAFIIVPPWRTPASETPSAAPLMARITNDVRAATAAAVVLLGIVFAIRNRRRGRADHRGAWRVALFIGLAGYLANLLRGYHSADLATEWDRIVGLAQGPLLNGVLVWFLYLAIEPYLRRRWPATLIGWSRLLAGRFQDPMVGRDLLVGCVAGGLIGVCAHAMLLLRQTPSAMAIDLLGSVSEVAGFALALASTLTLRAVGTGVMLLILHLLLRSRAVAIVGTALLWAMIAGSPGTHPALEIPMRLLLGAIVVGTYVRFGVLAAAVALFVQQVLVSPPLTLDTSQWFFAQSLVVVLLVAAIAGYGFYRAFGTQPLFARAILDE